MILKYISKVVLINIFLIITLQPVTAQTEWETVIPANSLTSANFSTYWEWFYPWGDTHNGSAKMYVNQVTLDSSGTAVILANTPDPSSGYKYRSGAFNSKALILCDAEYPEWIIAGEFRAPIVTGSWPAFWITRAGPWTSEVDILEYKGDASNWFNTYDGGWESGLVQINDAPDSWHKYECHLTMINAVEVKVEFYLDDELVATHTGGNFTGVYFDIIVNLQMEGSSGSPGPTDSTYYYARNIIVQRKMVPAPEGPPSAPLNLKATSGDMEIGLDWDASPEWDVDYYSVYRSTTSAGPYDLLSANIEATGYTDTEVANDSSYYYVVSATDLDGNESAQSDAVSITPLALYPLTVENYSFELPGTSKQQNWQNVPGWSSDYIASDSGVESDYPTTEGSWRGFMMNSDPSIWNLTNHTIAAAEKLQLAIDARSSNKFKISLYYDNEGSRVEIASKTVTPGSDYLKYTLSFTADSVPASIGKKIGIELNNIDTETSWVGLDNVRLNSSVEDLTGIDLDHSKDTGLLNSFHLDQNYPNPFNPATTITYTLKRSGKVYLSVFDINGKEIKTLVNQNQNSGTYRVKFTTTDLASGVYLYKIDFNSFVQTKKMILLH